MANLRKLPDMNTISWYIVILLKGKLVTFHTATICSIIHSDLTAVKNSAIGDIDLTLAIRIIRNYGMGAFRFPPKRRENKGKFPGL